MFFQESQDILKTANPKIYLGLLSLNMHLNHALSSMEDLRKEILTRRMVISRRLCYLPATVVPGFSSDLQSFQFTLESLKFQLLSWLDRVGLGRWHQEESLV
jgi:hypothetical protein